MSATMQMPMTMTMTTMMAMMALLNLTPELEPPFSLLGKMPSFLPFWDIYYIKYI